MFTPIKGLSETIVGELVVSPHMYCAVRRLTAIPTNVTHFGTSVVDIGGELYYPEFLDMLSA